MDHEYPSITAEPKAKRQKRSNLSSSQSTVVPSTPPSISGIFSLKLPSSSAMGTPAQHVGSPETSTPRSAEVGMASTPIDSHNPRGIRSMASLDLLEGDHFRIRGGLEKLWVLPKRLLASHSPYFATTASEMPVFLELSERDAFQLFVQWLYLGELDFDGVNVSSSILVCAWSLGDKFGCPAFKDHVMVQLIKLHRERGIDPLRLRHIFELAKSGSKLRKWAIDQFHAKITYGYAGYDHLMNKDRPGDKSHWKQWATDVKQFSQDFIGACLDAGQDMNRVKKPWEHGQQYMEVLSYAGIGGCKEEGRSTKAEATLTKAEGR